MATSNDYQWNTKRAPWVPGLISYSLWAQQSNCVPVGTTGKATHTLWGSVTPSAKWFVPAYLQGPFKFQHMVGVSLKLHTLYQMGSYCIELIHHLSYARLHSEKKIHSLQFIYIHKHIHNTACDFKFIPRCYLGGKVFFPLQINYKLYETLKVTVPSWSNF